MKVFVCCVLCMFVKLIVVVVCVVVVVFVYVQLSVLFYGQVDEWVGVIKFLGGNWVWNVLGGGMLMLYWGLYGVEDFGGGYKVIFMMESFFCVQNGQYGCFQGDMFFVCNVYVGISLLYGMVMVGCLMMYLFLLMILFNLFYDLYIFLLMVYYVFFGFGMFLIYLSDQGVVGDLGWNNVLLYMLFLFGGLNFGVMYVFGNQVGDNCLKKWSVQFNYVNGLFVVIVVYQYVNFNNGLQDLSVFVIGMKSQGIVLVGVIYDLKFVKLFGQYMYMKNDQVVGSWYVNIVQGGVLVLFGVGNVMVLYVYLCDVGGFDQMCQIWVVGYDYLLFKCIDVYVVYMNDYISGLLIGNMFGVGICVKF